MTDMNLMKFDVKELGGNMLATYLTEFGLSGSATITRRKTYQMIRTGVANGMWQGGYFVPQLQKFLNDLGVKERVAVQAGFQSIIMAGLDMMMSTDNVGLGVSVIEGTMSAYAGDALFSMKY